MLNQITIMGRLTRDPDLRTVGETSVCSFRIACDRDYKHKSGERETDFVDVIAWRKLAESVSSYFGKGRMALVVGRLQIRPWTDKDGVKRFNPEIVADHVYFGDSKSQVENKATESLNPTTVPDDFVPDFDETSDSELPF